MKVYQINSVCGIKSTGRICTDILEVLENSGHECRIAFGRETVPEKYKDKVYRIGSNFSVKLNALKARIFDNEGFNAKRATNKLIKDIEKFNPDVIHLHNLHGYYLNVKVLFDYLKRADKPVIWTLHDCWAFTGHCAYFDKVGCVKWQSECKNCSQRKTYPSSMFFDKAKRNYLCKKTAFTGVKNLTIITPSVWLKDKIEDSYLSEYKCKVIPNGIDLDVFKSIQSDFKLRYGLVDKKIILGVAGVWDERKGLKDFVELSKIISEDFLIVLVGLSEQQKNSLPENIIGITRTNSAKELAEIYSSANVLFNPTYEDNYPTVNLEAQACGTPVITYKTGGSIESVPQENVVEKGDYNQAYELMQTPLGVTNRESFAKQISYEKYIEFYNEVLK